MKHSKKYYILDEDTMERVRGTDVLNDINRNQTKVLNDYYTNIIKEKIEDKNKEQKEWKEFGQNLQPILKSTNLSVEEEKKFFPDQIMDFLRTQISSGKYGVALKLFALLSGIDGVKVSKEKIYVNEKALPNSMVEIFRDLITAHPFISYEYGSLLKMLAPFKDIKGVIFNKRALELIDSIRNGQNVDLNNIKDVKFTNPRKQRPQPQSQRQQRQQQQQRQYNLTDEEYDRYSTPDETDTDDDLENFDQTIPQRGRGRVIGRVRGRGRGGGKGKPKVRRTRVKKGRGAKVQKARGRGRANSTKKSKPLSWESLFR